MRAFSVPAMMAACACALIVNVFAAGTTAQSSERGPHPLDLPFPPTAPPCKWLNEKHEEIECSKSPWKEVDHCRMPSLDAVSSQCKKVFQSGRAMQGICYENTARLSA